MNVRTAQAPELTSLQSGRALAALAVLLFHTNVTIAKDKYLGVDVVPFFDAGNSGVEFFFVLSGFIIFFAHRSDVGRPERLSRYALKRFFRLVPLLWIVLTGITLSYVLLPSIRPPDGFDPAGILIDYLLLPTQGTGRLAVEWTLRHEAVFYVVFSLFILNLRAGIVGSALILAVSAWSVAFEIPYVPSKIFSVYNFLFAFGAAAYFASRHIERRHVTLALVGVAIFFSTWVYKLGHEEGAGPLVVLAYGLGAATTISALAGLEFRRKIYSSRVLVFLGDASYSIYLVHFPMISLFCKIVDRLHAVHPLNTYVYFVLVATPALVAGVVFHLLVERPLVAHSRALIGSWTRKTVPAAR